MLGRSVPQPVPPGPVRFLRHHRAGPGEHEHHRSLRLAVTEHLGDDEAQVPDELRVRVVRDVVDRHDNRELLLVPVKEEQPQALPPPHVRLDQLIDPP
jgi:hypothetical protein